MSSHFTGEEDLKNYLDEHNVPYHKIRYLEDNKLVAILLDNNYGTVEILRLFYGGYFRGGSYIWYEYDENSRWNVFKLDEIKKYEEHEFLDEQI